MTIGENGTSGSSSKRKRFRLFKRRKPHPPTPVTIPNAGARNNEADSSVSSVVSTPMVTHNNHHQNHQSRAPMMATSATVHSISNTITTKYPLPAEDRLPFKKSFLCRTKFFQDMINTSFELVDQDGSGTIDEKELYSGLLLIHLKLGTYAGPAACKPISREKCHAVFLKMDIDGSGHLDKEEFEAVMMVLFGNVMMRVLIQYACTLLIVPMVAQGILDAILWCLHYIYVFISTLDEHSKVANILELSLERLWHHAITYWREKLPTIVLGAFGKAQELLQAVPDSVWNSIPLTLLSTVLSLMLIPWSLLKIDDIFQSLADSGKKKVHTS